MLGRTYLQTLKEIKRKDPDYKSIPRRTKIPSGKDNYCFKARCPKDDLVTYLDRPFIPIIQLNDPIKKVKSLAKYIQSVCKVVTIHSFECQSSSDDISSILKLYRPETVPLVIIITKDIQDEKVRTALTEGLKNVLSENAWVCFLGTTDYFNQTNYYETLHESLEKDIIVTTSDVSLDAETFSTFEYTFPDTLNIVPNCSHQYLHHLDSI